MSAGALEKEITVNVKEIDSITITSLGNPSSIEATTQSLNLTAVILPLNEVKHVEWSVDNPDIATVTPAASNEIYASVKGLQAGNVVITAKVGSKMVSYNLEVTPYTGPYVYFECEGGTVKMPDENGYMSLTALDVGKFVVGGTYSGTPVCSCSGWVQSVNGDNQWHTFINPETGKYLPYGLGKLTVTVDAGGWSRTFTIQRESSGITELKTYVNGKEVTMDDPYTVVGTISGVTVNVQGKNADGNWVAVPTQALYYTSNNSNGSFRFVGNQMSITSGGEAEMIVSMMEDYSITTSFRAVCGEVAVESFEVIYPSTWTIDGSWDRMSKTFQPCWTLIALDSKKYEIPGDALWSRDELIRLLLAFRNKDGSFALSGTAGDVDMTGMILQALAPYNNESHPDVQAAFNDALIWLQGQMKGTAGFSENAGGNENSCSTAQILTALSVACIDSLDKNNGFTLGNHNMITNLYSYKAESGFCWEENGGGNMMGTYQVTYALEAYRRYAENENPLYDLTEIWSGHSLQ